MPRSLCSYRNGWLPAAMLLATWGTPAFHAAAQPAATEPAAETTAAPVAEAGATACVPECRDGFVCHEGQCISACNPACEGGLVCTGAGQCVPPPPPAEPPAAGAAYAAPLPPVEPIAADEPPPPGAWKPTFRERRKANYHFRPYVGLNLSLGGGGDASERTTYSYNGNYYPADQNYDLGIRPGIEAGFEFRFGRLFGIGPAFRLYSYAFRGTSLVDVLLTPTFHIPIGMVEIMIPLNVGATFASDDYDETATGFVFGVTPGVNLWFVPSFGIYAQVGLNFHLLVFDSYVSVDYRPMLNSGVTFGF